MGPVRGGLILSLLPGAALAETCAELRPNWDGVPVTVFGELWAQLSTGTVLILLFGSFAALRLKSPRWALWMVLCWAAYIYFLTITRPDTMQRALAEGCLGNPALFIGIIAAICVGMIFYTAPLTKER